MQNHPAYKKDWVANASTCLTIWPRDGSRPTQLVPSHGKNLFFNAPESASREQRTCFCIRFWFPARSTSCRSQPRQGSLSKSIPLPCWTNLPCGTRRIPSSPTSRVPNPADSFASEPCSYVYCSLQPGLRGRQSSGRITISNAAETEASAPL
jgi:hypothetical protein